VKLKLRFIGGFAPRRDGVELHQSFSVQQLSLVSARWRLRSSNALGPPETTKHTFDA